jgi:hypothetical protein
MSPTPPSYFPARDEADWRESDGGATGNSSLTSGATGQGVDSPREQTIVACARSCDYARPFDRDWTSEWRMHNRETRISSKLVSPSESVWGAAGVQSAIAGE